MGWMSSCAGWSLIQTAIERDTSRDSDREWSEGRRHDKPGSGLLVAVRWPGWTVVPRPFVDLVGVPDRRTDQSRHRLGEARTPGDLQDPLARHTEESGQLPGPVQAKSRHAENVGRQGS